MPLLHKSKQFVTIRGTCTVLLTTIIDFVCQYILSYFISFLCLSLIDVSFPKRIFFVILILCRICFPLPIMCLIPTSNFLWLVIQTNRFRFHSFQISNISRVKSYRVNKPVSFMQQKENTARVAVQKEAFYDGGIRLKLHYFLTSHCQVKSLNYCIFCNILSRSYEVINYWAN